MVDRKWKWATITIAFLFLIGLFVGWFGGFSSGSGGVGDINRSKVTTMTATGP